LDQGSAETLEFEVRCVWEASKSWIGRTAAIEFHLVVPFCFLSQTCVGMIRPLKRFDSDH
jgi:hypothetical protein